MGFVEAPQSADELAQVGKRVTPAVANIFEGGKTPVLPATELERMGFRLGIYPSQTQRAAIFAIKEALAVLKRDGDTEAIENRLATFADREDAVDSKRWRAIEERYLRNI
jgi:2-methylisocitrate lyase-like PEP mutase family enzyme